MLRSFFFFALFGLFARAAHLAGIINSKKAMNIMGRDEALPPPKWISSLTDILNPGDRPERVQIELGLAETLYEGRQVINKAPLAGSLIVSGAGESRSEIYLGEVAWNIPLDTQFTVAKMKMDDVHMWMKLGTGFHKGAYWVRVEWARPPRPPGNRFKTMDINGQNWYVADAVPQTDGIYIFHSKATTLKTPVTLKQILDAIEDVAIPDFDAYATLPGAIWVSGDKWNCYTALLEMLDRLGIRQQLWKPFWGGFFNFVTAGTASSWRRKGDDILTGAAKMKNDARKDVGLSRAGKFLDGDMSFLQEGNDFVRNLMKAPGSDDSNRSGGTDLRSSSSASSNGDDTFSPMHGRFATDTFDEYMAKKTTPRQAQQIGERFVASSITFENSHMLFFLVGVILLLLTNLLTWHFTRKVHASKTYTSLLEGEL